MIVKFVLCSRDQKLYITCTLSHYAKCFCIRVPRKRHRLRPAGRSVSGTRMHLQFERFYGLGIDGLEWNALEHERYSSFGMDVLVMGYSNLMNLQVGFRV